MGPSGLAAWRASARGAALQGSLLCAGSGIDPLVGRFRVWDPRFAILLVGIRMLFGGRPGNSFFGAVGEKGWSVTTAVGWDP